MLAGLVEETFALAGVGPGMRALDVGAGTGDQTLFLAERVGAAGSVLANDLSAAMLEPPREDAAAGDRTGIVGGLTGLARRAMHAGAIDEARALADEAHGLAVELGFRHAIAEVDMLRGDLALGSGAQVEAGAHYRHAVGVALDAGLPQAVGDAAHRLAHLAAAGAQHERVVRLSAALTDVGRDWSWRARDAPPHCDSDLDAAREALGQAAYGQAWDEGRAMSPAHTVAYALNGEEAGGRV